MTTTTKLSPEITSRQKIDALQSLRGLAFMGVFLTHLELVGLGNWGVSVFFVLSGFLMTYSYINKSLESDLKNSVKFSLKKIMKLYPLHAIITLYLIPVCWNNTLSWPPEMIVDSSLEKLIANLLLVQSWYPRWTMFFSFNGASWYLSTSLILYFCFPKILACIKKTKNSLTPYAVIATVYILQTAIAYWTSTVDFPVRHSDSFTLWFTYIFPPYRVGDFLIGCCLGYIFLGNQDRKISGNKYTAYEIFTLILLIISQYIYLNGINIIGFDWYKHTILYTPTSVLLVYLFAVNSGKITSCLNNRLMIFLGNISPYGFLLHNAVILTLKEIPIIYDNKAIFVLLSIVLTLIFSSFAYFCSQKRGVYKK